jgi:uncharacterized protein
MEQIAGRKQEIALLQGLLQKKRSEFVAVYGRRRIGKTFLVRQVYAQEIVFECSGLHQKSFAQQLENFWSALNETDPNAKIPPPKTWLQAFSQLKSYINHLPVQGKKVIFLDEVSWFETPRTGFLAALDNFWNQYCTKRDDLILVICGSAASWIIQKVVNDRGGLHNRITQHLQLMPFSLAETRDYLQMQGVRLTNRDVLLLYMCVGGVPFYLNDLKTGSSVPQILDALFFGPGARLKNEFRNLYAALFKNNALHEKVVIALASKNTGLTRGAIIEITKMPSGGALSTVLEELIACGFVQLITPFTSKKTEALYRLVDEFTLFYLRFFHAANVETSWAQVTASQSWHVWTGYAFESICLKHIQEIKRALSIAGIVSHSYSWQIKGTKDQPGAQIDLLIDRADQCINVLELKFHTAEFEMSKAYAAQLEQKVHIFRAHTKTKKNIFITMLATAGARKNEHYLSIVTNELRLEDLFNELPS